MRSIQFSAMLLILAAGCAQVEQTPDVLQDPGTDPGLDTVADPAPDTSADPAVDPDVPDETACPHEGSTISRIIDECVEQDTDRTQFAQCIDGLHDSWSTGLANRFECASCAQVYSDLRCLVYDNMYDFCDPDVAGEYSEEDLETFLDGCAVLLYLGVRFE